MDVYSVAAACLGLYVCVCIGMRAHDVVCMCTGSYAYYADVCRKPVVYAHVYLSGFAVCCVCVYVLVCIYTGLYWSVWVCMELYGRVRVCMMRYIFV